MLSLKLAPGSNPPLCRPRPMYTSCVCVCVFAFHTLCVQRVRGWVLSRRRRWDLGTRSGRKEKIKGACSKGNNRWTCSRRYGVSLITHRPHLLIYSNYLPTQWAPCQRRGVNTTDQIHLKIKVPTHSATPTRALLWWSDSSEGLCGREGFHVCSFM